MAHNFPRDSTNRQGDLSIPGPQRANEATENGMVPEVRPGDIKRRRSWEGGKLLQLTEVFAKNKEIALSVSTRRSKRERRERERERVANGLRALSSYQFPLLLSCLRDNFTSLRFKDLSSSRSELSAK